MKKRSCKDAPDQKTANEMLNFSESSPGNNIEVSDVNLVSNPTPSVANDVVSKVVIYVSILSLMKQV